VAVDVVVAEQAQRFALHDEVPTIEAGLLAERVVGLDRTGALLAREQRPGR